jgi:uncharacterized protein YegJ (DUF2314 family)
MENSNTKAMKSKISDEERCRHFLIKELNLSPIQANTLYDGYVKACLKYASQQSTPPVQDKPQKPDFEAMLKKNAFKSHPLNTDKDVVSIEHAEYVCEYIWKNYVDKAYFKK